MEAEVESTGPAAACTSFGGLRAEAHAVGVLAESVGAGLSD